MNTLEQTKLDVWTTINDLPFTLDVQDIGGVIYVVGGTVRDYLLNKQTKDLDLVISHVEFDDLIKILEKHGRVSLKGESFRVIKFTYPPKDRSYATIDISLPRVERSTGEGHKDFEVISNPYLTIEEDLFRRDFTVNSMAICDNGNFYDPYGGYEDLKKGIIRSVNPNAFLEDPLRMLRAVQFASRFGFSLEDNTYDMIKARAHSINRISAERVMTELEKIVMKGSVRVGFQYLESTQLYTHLFDTQCYIGERSFESVHSRAEFLYLLYNESMHAPKLAKEILKAPNDVVGELEALVMLKRASIARPEEVKYLVFKALNKCPAVIHTKITNGHIRYILSQFNNGRYPTHRGQIKISGTDLEKMGLHGSQIGGKLNEIIIAILNDRLINTKHDILEYLADEGTLLGL